MNDASRYEIEQQWHWRLTWAPQEIIFTSFLCTFMKSNSQRVFPQRRLSGHNCEYTRFSIRKLQWNTVYIIYFSACLTSYALKKPRLGYFQVDEWQQIKRHVNEVDTIHFFAIRCICIIKEEQWRNMRNGTLILIITSMISITVDD